MPGLTYHLVTLDDAAFLFALLAERPPAANISHAQMPMWEEHVAFIQSCPYLAWEIIVREPRPEEFPEITAQPVGAIYLTDRHEVGIAILSSYQGMGIGSQALEDFLIRYPLPRTLANVSPTNTGSQRFFERHGFTLIQYTYARTAHER